MILSAQEHSLVKDLAKITQNSSPADHVSNPTLNSMQSMATSIFNNLCLLMLFLI
jgi:hypothetical protein